MSKLMLAAVTAEHLAVMEITNRVREALLQLQAVGDLAEFKRGLGNFGKVMDQTVNSHFCREEEEVFPKLMKSCPHLSSEIQNLQQDHRVISLTNHCFQEELAAINPPPEIILQTGTELLDQLSDHFQREHRVFGCLQKS